ncbi:hypothetical protein AVEN_104881-1 [Araneus ventricosus]|uniref:Uncharacterized protein n=1 Tax=Araneus ventricosus TaxID=182803 RepID=A0A4Y2FG67_ARAVE|nr:hypothetical protein AVEN_104881-1 [Araneus ventricosus]
MNADKTCLFGVSFEVTTLCIYAFCHRLCKDVNANYKPPFATSSSAFVATLLRNLRIVSPKANSSSDGKVKWGDIREIKFRTSTTSLCFDGKFYTRRDIRGAP